MLRESAQNMLSQQGSKGPDSMWGLLSEVAVTRRRVSALAVCLVHSPYLINDTVCSNRCEPNTHLHTSACSNRFGTQHPSARFCFSFLAFSLAACSCLSSPTGQWHCWGRRRPGRPRRRRLSSQGRRRAPTLPWPELSSAPPWKHGKTATSVVVRQLFFLFRDS